MRPSAAEIVAHHSDEPGLTQLMLLPGWEQWSSPKLIIEHDPDWAEHYDNVAATVRSALGSRVLELHHVGSTAVPGMPAKPVIDVDLVVADPTAELQFLPDLEAAGFHFHAREPGWHQHRLLKLRTTFTHLHVFGPDCPEVVRHVMFRDWLATHPEDRNLYAEAKLRAAAQHSRAVPYTQLKGPVVRQIHERLFRAQGLT